MRAFTLSLLALLLIAAPASAQVLESPVRATPVDADRGNVVFSQIGADGRFRLAVHPASGARYTLDVPPQAQAFDADLGTDASGQPVVVYASCPTVATLCDIRVHSLTTGQDAAIPAAAKPNVDEQAPTVFKGRVVWSVVEGAKADAGAPSGVPKVLTQALGSTAAPTTLPALPRRRCGKDFDGRRFCERPAGRVVAQELQGDRLAQAVGSYSPKLMTRGIEMRLVGVKQRTSVQVASAGAGEGGQSYIGPSFDAGRLYWFMTCSGDPSGCDRSGGTYRYAPGAERLERSLAPRQLAGFTVDGGRAIVAEGSEARFCEVEQGAYPGLKPGTFTIGPCPITAQPLPSSWSVYRQRRG